MTLEEVLEAKADGRHVLYDGREVTIVKASLQMVYVQAGPGAALSKVTPEQLVAMPDQPIL